MTKTKITKPFNSWLLLLLLLRNPTGTLGAADIAMICQDTAYTDGATSEVFCYINTTAVASAACFVTPSVVLIQIKRQDRLPIELCQTTYPGTCINPNVSCGCASNINNVAKYQVQFTANETTQKGGDISCTIGCEPPLSTNTTSGCQSLIFQAASNSIPSINKTDNADQDESACTKSCIIGLAVGLPLGIAAIAGGIIVGVLCKMGKIGYYQNLFFSV